MRDNLVQSDVELAIREASEFKRAGGGAYQHEMSRVKCTCDIVPPSAAGAIAPSTVFTWATRGSEAVDADVAGVELLVPAAEAADIAVVLGEQRLRAVDLLVPELEVELPVTRVEIEEALELGLGRGLRLLGVVRVHHLADLVVDRRQRLDRDSRHAPGDSRE